MKMKALMRLIGISLALLLLLSMNACIKTQAEATGAKAETEATKEQEKTDDFDYMLFLKDNNHLILQKNDELILDIDLAYIWKGDPSGLIFLSGSLGELPYRLTHTSEEATSILSHYFGNVIFLKEISCEECELPEDHKGVLFYKYYSPEDGSGIFEFAVLKDGTLQFVDSNDNIYVSGKGLFEK